MTIGDHSNQIDNSTSLPDEVSSEIEIIQSLLTMSKRFVLASVVCNDLFVQRLAVKQLRDALPSIEVIEVTQDSAAPFIEADRQEVSNCSALIILGLDSWLSDEASRMKRISIFNASRERWPARFNCPVLLWMNRTTAGLLAQYAPDLWRYRSHRFELLGHVSSTQMLTSPGTHGEVEATAITLHVDAARDRIAELRSRLVSLEDNPGESTLELESRWRTEIGFHLYQLGDLDEAEIMIRMSLEINEKLGLLEGIAVGYSNLGLIYQTRGDLDEAENMIRKSLEINEKLGRLEGMAISYGNLGLIFQTRGDLDEAENMILKSLEINEKLGRLEGLASQYGNLGLINKKHGNLDEAEKMFHKSLEISEKLGRLDGMANQYGNLGLVYKARGDLDESEKMHRKSLQIEEKLGRLEGMANDYGNLGNLAELQGKMAEARELWTQSRDLFNQVGMPHMVEKMQGWLDELDADTDTSA